MPVDPATGESLPYAGEAGAAPDAPPVPSAPAVEGAPPEGAPAEGDPEMIRLEQIAASAPPPEKPFSVKTIETVVSEFNAAMSKLSGGEIPEIEVDLSAAKNGKWDAPLPPELFLPLVAISEALGMIGGGEYADKYGFDPFDVTTDTDLRKVAAQFKRMAKDKKLIADLQEGAEVEGEEMPEEEGAEMAPPPAEMGEEDQVLAAGME